MTTHLDFLEKNNIFYSPKYDSIIDDNDNDSNNILITIKQDNISSDNRNNHNIDVFKDFTNILKDNNQINENDEINYEDLYFINKLQISDKKNESTSCTDGKLKNNESYFLSKKRNNHVKYKRKKQHSKFDKDNLMKKLNIHYISFIVKYVNFNIQRFISRKHPLFANLCYEFKKKLNSTTFNKLKNMTLGEVLKNEGSNKNKRNMIYEKDENEKLFKSVYETELKNLLDINYIEFFKQVYSKTSPLDKIKLDFYKKFKAPKKILFLDDFIKKEVEKDKINGELYKKRIKLLTKNEFLKDKYPFFLTKVSREKKKNAQF